MKSPLGENKKFKFRRFYRWLLYEFEFNSFTALHAAAEIKNWKNKENECKIIIQDNY